MILSPFRSIVLFSYATRLRHPADSSERTVALIWGFGQLRS